MHSTRGVDWRRREKRRRLTLGQLIDFSDGSLDNQSFSLRAEHTHARRISKRHFCRGLRHSLHARSPGSRLSCAKSPLRGALESAARQKKKRGMFSILLLVNSVKVTHAFFRVPRNEASRRTGFIERAPGQLMLHHTCVLRTNSIVVSSLLDAPGVQSLSLHRFINSFFELSPY